MKRIISWLDFSGNPFELYPTASNKKFSTIFGSIMGFFSLIILAILFIFFGRNFYSRANPNSSISKIYIPNYQNYSLTNKTFSFAFRVDDQDGALVDRDDYFYYEPHYLVYKKNESGSTKVIDEILKFHRCKAEDAGNNSIYTVLKMKDWYCFDKLLETEGLTVGGLQDSELVQYIKIRLFNCKKRKNSNITCSTNRTEMSRILNSYIYFSMILQSYAMDVNNYTDPFQVGFNYLYETIDPKITKKNYYYFKKGIMEDNKGWVTDDTQVQNLYGLDRSRTDVFTSTVSDIFDMEYYQVNLYFDKIEEKYTRTFMKVQELVANIGGVLKAYTVLYALVIGQYNKFYLYEYLINQCLTSEKKEKSPIDKQNASSRIVPQNLFINSFKPDQSVFAFRNPPFSGKLSNTSYVPFSNRQFELRISHSAPFTINCCSYFYSLICCQKANTKKKLQLEHFSQMLSKTEKLLNAEHLLKMMILQEEKNMNYEEIKIAR